MGKGATVLVHEATFECDFSHHAVAKRHSTIGEALNVGKMGFMAISAGLAVMHILKHRDPGHAIDTAFVSYARCP